jgi:hypothetical protein
LAVSALLSFLAAYFRIVLADIRFALCCLFLYGAAEKIGESWKLRLPNTEDPLLGAVNLLESN